MFEYSIYEKSNKSHFNVENPKPRKNKREIVYFNIILVNRILKISIYKDSSLEDLYIKIYNTVYPDFSTENITLFNVSANRNVESSNDVIPLKTHIDYKTIPKIYSVCVIDKDENIVTVPLHKFIPISSYMKSKPTFFKNSSFFGKPVFKIYVLDEYALNNVKKNTTTKQYIQKYINCFTNSPR